MVEWALLDRNLWCYILSLLPPRDILACMGVSHTIQTHVRAEPTWQRHRDRVLTWCPSLHSLFCDNRRMPRTCKRQKKKCVDSWFVFSNYLLPNVSETIMAYPEVVDSLVRAIYSIIIPNHTRSIRSIEVVTNRTLIFECIICLNVLNDTEDEYLDVIYWKYRTLPIRNVLSYNMHLSTDVSYDAPFIALVNEFPSHIYTHPRVIAFPEALYNEIINL